MIQKTQITDDLIVNTMPYLNRYALKLTRNRDRADDLIQWTILAAIEHIRKQNTYMEKPRSWLARIMYYQYVYRFLRRDAVQRGSCEYEEGMKISHPEQGAIPALVDVKKYISRQKTYSQDVILKLIGGEDWPKYKKAGMDFRKHMREALYA